METEVKVQEAPVMVNGAVSAEPIQMKHVYKASACTKCKKTAVFFPKRNRTICMSCLGIEGIHESMDITEFLPRQYMHEMIKKEELSKYAIHFKDPRSSPTYAFPDRNAPCSCGSTKKFKKCCMGKLMDEMEQNCVKMYSRHRAQESVDIANDIKEIRTVYAHLAVNKWTEIPVEDIKWEHLPVDINPT